MLIEMLKCACVGGGGVRKKAGGCSTFVML